METHFTLNTDEEKYELSFIGKQSREDIIFLLPYIGKIYEVDFTKVIISDIHYIDNIA